MEKWPGRSLNVFHYQASCDKLRTPQFGWMCDSQSRGGEGGRAGCTAGFEEAHKRHSPICFRNKICIISGCLQSPKFALLGKKLLIFSTNLELNLHISQKETQAAVDERQCWSCRTDRAQRLPAGQGHRRLQGWGATSWEVTPWRIMTRTGRGSSIHLPWSQQEGLCWLCSNFPGFSPVFPCGTISARSSGTFLWEHGLGEGRRGWQSSPGLSHSASDLCHTLCFV